MSLRWRSLSWERMRDFVYFIFEELFTTVSVVKHGNDAFYMLNVIWKFVKREDEVTEEEQWRNGTVLCLQFVIALKLHQPHLQGGRRFVHRKVKGGGEQFEAGVSGLTPVKRKANSSPKEVTTSTHVIRCTSHNARKIHKLTSSQLSFPQAQIYLEGSDVWIHVCDKNVFALQLHILVILVCSDIYEQGHTSWVRTRRDRSREFCFTHRSTVSKMSCPVVLPWNGTSWRYSS